MKIASNTKLSFYPRQGFSFCDLGDDISETSAIVLMLKKNWGSASIDSINDLTENLSKYPKEIPCYIIGCESTIPHERVTLFHHSERDQAIKALCDEVLKRSKSIGVRGTITQKYLTEVLGISSDKIEIIFTGKKNDKENRESIRSFINKLDPRLNPLDNDAFLFQKNPIVIYERPVVYNKTITIGKPYITQSLEKVRLNSNVTIDGKITTLWCETDENYQQFLLQERSDAFLCAILPFAMRAGKDIFCEIPVSEHFLHNLVEVLIPQLCTHDSRLYQTKIIAKGASETLFSENGVATGMSCGVDSFYTVNLYKDSNFKSMKLTHLYCGNYLYGNDGPIYKRAESVSKELNIPLVKTSTNINQALPLPHLYTHFFKTMFGVLALKKLFRTYLYSSAEDFSHFKLKDNSTTDTAKFELLLIYCFSSPDFQVVTGGGKSDRLEKTRSISEFETSQKFLNVCLHPNNEINCGKCGKCMRTLLMLDMLGTVDKFKNVFNVEEYYKNKIDSLVYLVSQKKMPMLASVYEYFEKNDHENIKKAEKIFTSK